MFKWLFLLFLSIPVIEIFLLLQVGTYIGVWPTILLIITTAFFGAKLVRSQGMITVQQLQHKLGQGHLPANELIAGLCIVISGCCLVTPGILTDLLGFTLLLPWTRTRLVRYLKQHMAQKWQTHTHFSHTQFHGHEHFSVHPEENTQTLEGEFTKKDHDKIK